MDRTALETGLVAVPSKAELLEVSDRLELLLLCNKWLSPEPLPGGNGVICWSFP